MDNSKIYLEIAHKFSFKNMNYLRNDSICGCFYCLEIFTPKEIKEVIEESDGIDDILGAIRSDLLIIFLSISKSLWYNINQFGEI